MKRVATRPVKEVEDESLSGYTVDVTSAAPAPAVSLDPSSASPAPFDLPGGPDAVLLLHGLTGSPYEVRHVADRLHASGVRCLGPVMPGHGGDPRALLGLRWQDWVDGARNELSRLDGARRVLVVGCSMGALVACVLAHAKPERIAGLALLAPALRLHRAGRFAAFLGGRRALRRLWPLVPKPGGSDVADPLQRRVNPTMRAVPLAAVRELVELGHQVERLLPAITQPAVVIIGRHDHTVQVAGAKRIAQRIGSAPATLVVLERSFHLVGIDVERERCASEVASFLDRIVATGGDPTDGGAGWRPT